MKDERASTRVALLGLGAMGLPMATWLAQHFEVDVYDPDPSRIELAAKAGVHPADTAAAACRHADVAVISVRTADQMQHVLFGAGEVQGIAQALRPGAAVVMTSTVGADAVRHAAEELRPFSIGLVDAPVSGGSVRAASGDLLVMVGASREHLEVTRPVLDLLGSTVYVVGSEPGDGQTMKTVNQLLCGVHTAAAAEALALAHSLGLDLERCLQILQSGAAASFMLADRGPRMIAQLRSEPVELRSRTDVMAKDMGIVQGLCQTSGVLSPVAEAAYGKFRAAVRAGMAEQDDSSITIMQAPITTPTGGPSPDDATPT
ncbi:3-hydroxyisobutyrate dehydrogenase [Nakamurella sp. UYEF19]|uniref:NAD(P)-dependent oxidoreductase n=1 Tax=Nakamurella sp. UYEF19 TaxID=1756392 RepID=UPI00339260C8